ESGSNENPRSPPAPPVTTSHPQPRAQTGSSSPLVASAQTCAVTPGGRTPSAPRLKSPASGYPRGFLLPQRPAADSSIPFASASAAEIPTNSDVEKKASQR